MENPFQNGFDFGSKIGGALGNAQRKKVYGETYAKDGWKGLGEVAGASGDLETAQAAQSQVTNQEETAFKKAQRNMTVLGNAVRAVQSLPYEQRKPRIQQMAPMLQGLGLDGEKVSGYDPTDENNATILAQLGEFGKYRDYKTVDDVLYGIGADGTATALTERKPKPPVPTDLGDRVVFRDPETGEVVQEMPKGAAPRAPGSGRDRANWRPMTPQDKAAYGLTGDQPYLIDDDTGNVKPVAGGKAAVMADPAQRGRVIISFPNAVEAIGALDAKEKDGYSYGKNDWGARLIDSTIPGEGGDALAKAVGGDDYQAYLQASSAFEAAMLPILSGAAVTESEAKRVIRAVLPQLGDGPEALKTKARARKSMANGAAMMIGEPIPYPDAPSVDLTSASARAALTGGSAGAATSSPAPTQQPAAVSGGGAPSGVVKWGKDAQGNPVRLP